MQRRLTKVEDRLDRVIRRLDERFSTVMKTINDISLSFTADGQLAELVEASNDQEERLDDLQECIKLLKGLIIRSPGP